MGAALKQFVMELPEPPSANRWWRKWNNRMVLSKEARDYKKMVWADAFDLYNCPLPRHTKDLPVFPTGNVKVTLSWVRSRKAGDLDKRIGVVLDALQGVAYANDSQIVEIHASRFDNKANAGLRVTVEAV